MNEPIAIEHALAPEQAVERLAELARRHEVTLTPGADATAGRLEKSMGLFGSVRGRYRIEASRVEIVVESAPAMVGGETLRRMLGDALQEAFGA
jgi:hypothetical protein